MSANNDTTTDPEMVRLEGLRDELHTHLLACGDHVLAAELLAQWPAA